MNNQKKGFTLIELLVVIAIIGILSTIGLVALNGARAKARDTQRVSALRQYALAYQSWADSNGGSFVIPTATCAWDSDGRRASQCGTLKLFFGAGTNAPEDPSSTTSVTVVAANCATASTAGCFAQVMQQLTMPLRTGLQELRNGHTHVCMKLMLPRQRHLPILVSSLVPSLKSVPAAFLQDCTH